MKHVTLALLAALVFLLPGSAGAAGLVPTASSEANGTTSLSWSHVEPGYPEVAVVLCYALGVGAADYFSGAGYGTADNMTFIGSAVDTTGEAAYIEAYWLPVSSQNGTRTASCTLQNSPGDVYGVAITFNGNTANQNGYVVGTLCTVSGDADPISCGITGTSGNITAVVAAFSGHDDISAISSIVGGIDLQQQEDHVTFITMGYADAAESASTTVGFDMSASEDAAMVAFALQEAPVDADANAFEYIGELGTATCGPTVSSCALTTSATLEVGNLAVCSASKDEAGAGTTDGDNTQFTTAADSGATNTWIRAAENCNMNTATVADGQCAAMYYSKATAQLNSGGTITVNYAASTARGAITCQEFSTPRNVRLIEPTTTGVDWRESVADAAKVGSLGYTANSPAADSTPKLYYRLSGLESNDTASLYPSPNRVMCTTATSNSGVTDTSSQAFCEWGIGTQRILQYGINTTTSGSTPATASSDNASLYFVFGDAGGRGNWSSSSGE